MPSIIANRRAVLPSRQVAAAVSLPAWLMTADGIAPDLAFDFNADKAWSAAAEVSPASLLSCARALASYGRDNSGNYQSFAQDTLRYDYSGGVRRLLVEEARTNGVTNNSGQGAAAGTPGTNPTDWTIANAFNGLSKQIVGTGVSSEGIEYVDIRWFTPTTASSTSAPVILQFHPTTGFAAVSGQTAISSCWMAVVAGSISPLTVVSLRTRQLTSAGVLLSGATTVDVKASLTSSLQRFSAAFTLNDATAANAQFCLVLGTTSGVAYDFTLRFGWPQIELGSFVTSPIRTTAGAVTRPADVVSMALPVAMQGKSAYTLFAKWLASANSVLRSQATLAAATTSNRISLTTNASNQLDPIVYSGGSDTYGGLTPAVSAASHKAAIAATANDATAYMDGTTLNNDTSITMPAANITHLFVGSINDSSGLNGSAYLNNGVEQIAVYGSRRTDNPGLFGITS